MTRSKIQKMKFFIFLLICLLTQTTICDGSFREKRVDTPIIENKDNIKVGGTGAKINESAAITSARKDAGQQQDIVGSSNDVKVKSAADAVNRTHDDTISKPSAPAVVAADKIAHTANTSDEHYSNENHTTFNTGALIRGFFVFVGLSILVMAYIVFRSLRLSKTRAQMVRKYGVLTHRQDVEMRPLPLEEEDDEDTTVFDASNVLTNNVQHQST